MIGAQDTVQPIDGVDVHIDGSGVGTLVMVHGWPDTYRLWDEQVAFLQARHRCVRFTLPGFSATAMSAPHFSESGVVSGTTIAVVVCPRVAAFPPLTKV